MKDSGYTRKNQSHVFEKSFIIHLSKPNPRLNQTNYGITSSNFQSNFSAGSVFAQGQQARITGKIKATGIYRAAIHLDNKYLCDPKAFTPLKFTDGKTLDQQLAFYLSDAEILLSLFNFDNKKEFNQTSHLADFGLGNSDYIIKDFLTDQVIGKIEKAQDSFSLNVPIADARVVKLAPSN